MNGRSTTPVKQDVVHAAGGFSLIELTVVIAVISILLGAVIAPLSTQYTARQLRNERVALQEVRDALIGFAVVNRRLPCPDNDGDGSEDRVGGVGSACAPGTAPAETIAEWGFLPWVDIGVRGTDTWGRLYRYRVAAQYVLESTPGTPAPNATGLDLADPGESNIDDYDDSKGQVVLANNAAAVVVSSGSNGLGATDIDGNALGAIPAANANEAENADGDAQFVFRKHSPASGSCDDTFGSAGPLCEFDDLLIWVSPNLLFLRMVEGGALP